jgi:DNA-nicking Smr family endonuclease
VTVDLHNMNVFQARVKLNYALKKATGATYRLRVVHGYNLGSAIKDMVRSEFKDHPKVLRIESSVNPGETILVLRDLTS